MIAGSVGASVTVSGASAVPSSSSVATTVWSPATASSGTSRSVTNDPSSSVVTVTESPTGSPASSVSCTSTSDSGANPSPTTSTVPPAATSSGVTVITGSSWKSPHASTRAPAFPRLIRAASIDWTKPRLNADTSRLEVSSVPSGASQVSTTWRLSCSDMTSAIASTNGSNRSRIGTVIKPVLMSRTTTSNTCCPASLRMKSRAGSTKPSKTGVSVVSNVSNVTQTAVPSIPCGTQSLVNPPIRFSSMVNAAEPPSGPPCSSSTNTVTLPSAPSMAPITMLVTSSMRSCTVSASIG